MSVYSVNVHPTSVKLNVGQWYYGAYAYVDASSDCCTDVTWYSDNPNVASVNQSSGYVYARSAGTTRIYAVSKIDNSQKDYCVVTVEQSVSIQSVSLSSDEIIMNIGDVDYLSATVLPANAPDKRVRWCSNNPSVVCVDYYTGEITAISAGTASVTAYSAYDNSIGSEGCSITVLSQERTVRANGVIQENASYIRSAANMFGLQPVDVAMAIYAEQCINVDWKDEVIDPLLAPTLNVSLGLGQMRISTARKVEDNGYLPITHYTEWHGNNSVENRDAGIAIKLLNAQENAKYVAGYLAYIIDLWKHEYPYISCDAGVLATLYNRGEEGQNNAGPHSNPVSNPFGEFASEHRALLNCLLQ